MDYILYFKVLVPLYTEKKNYWKGWGKKETYEKLFNRKYNPRNGSPILIQTINVSEKVKDRDSDCYFRRELISFESPCSDLLDEGERDVDCSFLSYFGKSSKHCLVLLLPAAGQSGWRYRMKNFSAPLVREGKGKIDCLMVSVPTYGTRCTEEQKKGKISWLSVIHTPRGMISSNEELRSLAKHYGKIYKYVILAGVSLGGHVVGNFSTSPVCDGEDIKIGIVSVMGGKELRFDGLQGISSLNKKALNETEIPVKDCLEVFPPKDDSLVERIHSVTKYYSEKCYHDYFNDIKNNVLYAITLRAEFDKMITKEDAEKLDDNIVHAIERSKFFNKEEEEIKDHFEKRKLPGGHFKTFVDEFSLKKIRKAIFDCLGKMEEFDKKKK